MPLGSKTARRGRKGRSNLVEGRPGDLLETLAAFENKRSASWACSWTGDSRSQLPYPGSCLPYPFTCIPWAVVVYRKARKERVDTDGRRHTHCKPPPGVPGGATAPARAVAHNSGTCLPRPPGSMPGCPGDTMPTAASSDTSSGGQPCTFGPPRRVARDRSPNTRSLLRYRRIRPLYTSLVYCLVANVLCIRLSYTFFCTPFVTRFI